MNKLVSVVVATCNRKDLLLATLASIRNQTWSPLEIIVVDDGSRIRTFDQDESRELGIRYFYRENSGTAAARNFGVAQSEGDFIAFVDDDDLWLPNRIERQMAEINKGWRWVACDCTYFNSETGIDYDRHSRIHPSASGEVFVKLLQTCFIASPTVLIEKSLFVEAGGFNEDRRARYGEDWCAWLRIAAKAPLAFLPEPLARYRIHKSSMLIKSNLSDVLESHRLGLADVFAKVPQKFQCYQRMAKIWDLRTLSRTAFGRKEYLDARKFAFSAWKLNPFSFGSIILLAATCSPPRMVNRLRPRR